MLNWGLTVKQKAAGTQGIHTLIWSFPCRLPLGRNQPELGWPSIYQSLRCHQVACVSAVGEKPDLSIISSDLFNLNFPAQEKEAKLPRSPDHIAASMSGLWRGYFPGKFFPS